MKKIVFFIWIIVGLLVSCETPISITLPEHSATTVVEGWIENGQHPVVIVSHSMDYYSSIGMDAILASVEKNCIVKVTDSDGNEEQLQLGFTYDHIFGLLNAAYVGKSLVGQPGKTYYLYIEDTAGNIYTSTTTIPQNTVQVDSVKINIEHPEDTTALGRIYFTDNSSTYDCYRFFTKVKNLDVIYTQILYGCYDDLTFSGKQMNYEMIRMPMSNLDVSALLGIDAEEYARMYFKKGDTVYVKSTITDTATLNYWFPMQVDINMMMMPFRISGTYPTNITGDNVIGIWSGYHARYDTLVFE